MIEFSKLIRNKKYSLLSILLFVFFFGVISCNSDEVTKMPDFIKKGTLYPIEVNMNGCIRKSELRAFANTGKFDIGYENESNIFIAYQNEENIPCVLFFRNANNHSETFMAKGKAEISTNRPQGAEPSRNDMVNVKLQVSADVTYKIDGNWEVKPIIGFNENDKGVFEPVNELKTTNRKVKTLSIPITSDWVRLKSSKINSEKFVDIDNISFVPDGVVLNISLQSEFADPVMVRRIFITPNSKIAHNVPYGIAGTEKEGTPIWIDDSLDDNGERIYGKLSNYNDKLNHILVWANIINDKTNNIQSYFDFYPISRDPFVDKSKRYKTNFVTPYGYLNWVANPENVSNITSGKAYAMNMKVKSLDFPMITEVYLDGEYSMVEIYNPTNRDINLSDYFLVKTKSNGEFSLDKYNNRELYILDGYPYKNQGTLGLPLYVDAKHNNTKVNIYERQIDRSDLVIFGDDESNILCSYNTPIMTSSNQNVLKAGKSMIICGPGYLKADGSFDRYTYNSKNPNGDITKSKANDNIQIFVAIDNSGFSSANMSVSANNKDIKATLNLKNNEGLAIIKKLNHGDIATMSNTSDMDKYMVVDVFPYDDSRAGLQAPFYMCRYDGIVFPYNRSAKLEDHDYGERVNGKVVLREGLNKQWYKDEIGGTEEIHSLGSRYRSW